jgi:hypothetical protein
VIDEPRNEHVRPGQPSELLDEGERPGQESSSERIVEEAAALRARRL